MTPQYSNVPDPPLTMSAGMFCKLKEQIVQLAVWTAERGYRLTGIEFDDESHSAAWDGASAQALDVGYNPGVHLAHPEHDGKILFYGPKGPIVVLKEER